MKVVEFLLNCVSTFKIIIPLMIVIFEYVDHVLDDGLMIFEFYSTILNNFTFINETMKQRNNETTKQRNNQTSKQHITLKKMDYTQKCRCSME